ncbi:MAG: ribonuclease J [Pseudomonadota bacterium]
MKILPLGGLGEIGMNMMIVQYGMEAVAVDCGIMFSDEDLPGIDLVVPDLSYVLNPSLSLKALILTHGHEDHIGGVPYLLRQRDVPVYGSRFTLALVKARLSEHELLRDARLEEVKEGDRIKLGPFSVEFIEMSHSIADALALAIRTPEGTVILTGDFKIDPKPVDGRRTDMERFSELGKEGVFLLMSDSTNVEVPGPSVSESTVRADLEKLIRESSGWTVIASFASHIPRLKQLIDIAVQQKKKLLLAGRSMIQNVGIARKLGYLRFPDSLLVEEEQVRGIDRKKLIILSTGTQGEVRSALARMALDEHKGLRLRPNDRVILSSRFIPGNEKAIFSIINHLCRRGADVFSTQGAHVHVSGHGYREDLARVLRAVHPRFFIPVHGEYRHLKIHLALGEETGVKKGNAFLIEDGQGVEFLDGKASMLPPIELRESVVDGKDLVEVGSDVLRDRKHLSATGMVVAVVILDRHSGNVLQEPELFTRGFLTMDDGEGVLEEAREALRKHLSKLASNVKRDDAAMQDEIRAVLRRFFRSRVDRRPVVIPVVMEV